jgi:hypothetical protein
MNPELHVSPIVRNFRQHVANAVHKVDARYDPLVWTFASIKD